MDDDCDNVIDEVEFVPCVTPSNQPGSAECLEGGMVSEDCVPDDPNREEICDGRDNDLDGLVDENTSRDCMNGCHFGREVCIEGQMRDCSAAAVLERELCNGIDDNCDGENLIDEMAECPGEEICGEEGQCLLPCQNDECLPGFTCESDGYCHPFPCNPSCAEGQRCINQECVRTCLANAQCNINEICDADAQRCIPDPNASASMGGNMSGGSSMGGEPNASMGGMTSSSSGGSNPNPTNPTNQNGQNMGPTDPNSSFIPPVPQNPATGEDEPAVASSCSTPSKPYALWGFLFAIFTWIQLLKRDQFKA